LFQPVQQTKHFAVISEKRPKPERLIESSTAESSGFQQMEFHNVTFDAENASSLPRIL
jgi:hypothetical protein